MSIKVMTAVWEHSQHKGTELLLLLALADFAHDDGGGIYPKVDTMAKKIRMSERNTRYVLRKLEDSGELVAVGPHQTGTTLYRIDLDRVGAKIAGGQRLPGQGPAPGGANGRTKGGQPIAPDPSLIHQESPRGSLRSIDEMRRAVRPSGLGRR